MGTRLAKTNRLSASEWNHPSATPITSAQPVTRHKYDESLLWIGSGNELSIGSLPATKHYRQILTRRCRPTFNQESQGQQSFDQVANHSADSHCLVRIGFARNAPQSAFSRFRSLRLLTRLKTVPLSFALYVAHCSWSAACSALLFCCRKCQVGRTIEP